MTSKSSDSWDELSETKRNDKLESLDGLDESSQEILINSFAEKYNTTVGQIKQHLEIFSKSPKYSGEGEVVADDLGGTDPSFFQMEAKAISYENAFCEIIDGIIENHTTRADDKKVTNVEFKLQLGGTRLEISEDSGGIPKDKFDSVAKLGGSGWGKGSQAAFSIGVFGVGLKKGLRKIGKDHKLFTWYDGGGDDKKADPEPCEIAFSPGYWDDVGVAKTKALETNDKVMKTKKGFTIITIAELEEYDNEPLEFTQEFVKGVGKYYGQILSKIPGEVNISFIEGTDEPIKMPVVDLFSDDLIRREFGYFPGYEPRQFIYKFEGKKDPSGKRHPVKVTLKFGITRINEDMYNTHGVYVYGNNRFFYGPSDSKGNEWGFGQQTKHGEIKQLHATTFGFKAKVDIEADYNLDIPWNIGEKNGYDDTNPTHTHVTRMVQYAAFYYMKMTAKMAKHHQFVFGINGVDRKTNEFWKDAFFPNNKEDLTDSDCKKSIEKLDNWVPRKKILAKPVDFSKLNSNTDSHGSWVTSDLDSIRHLLSKKIEVESFSDHNWVDQITSFYSAKMTKQDESKIKELEKAGKEQRGKKEKAEQEAAKNQDEISSAKAQMRKSKEQMDNFAVKDNAKYNKAAAQHEEQKKKLKEAEKAAEAAKRKANEAIRKEKQIAQKKLDVISSTKTETISKEAKELVQQTRKLKDIKKNQKVQSYVSTYILEYIQSETGLTNDSNLTRSLMAHFLLTQDSFDESKIPEMSKSAKGVSDLENWWKKQSKKSKSKSDK